MTENYDNDKENCNEEDDDNVNYDETSSRRASRNFGMLRRTEASIAGTK